MGDVLFCLKLLMVSMDELSNIQRTAAGNVSRTASFKAPSDEPRILTETAAPVRFSMTDVTRQVSTVSDKLGSANQQIQPVVGQPDASELSVLHLRNHIACQTDAHSFSIGQENCAHAAISNFPAEQQKEIDSLRSELALINSKLDSLLTAIASGQRPLQSVDPF